jgi:hypothetical protein
MEFGFSPQHRVFWERKTGVSGRKIRWCTFFGHGEACLMIILGIYCDGAKDYQEVATYYYYNNGHCVGGMASEGGCCADVFCTIRPGEGGRVYSVIFMAWCGLWCE